MVDVFTASATYDQFGRTFQVFDGAETYSGLAYYYNGYGHLLRAIESRGSASVTTERYRITGKDARGQVTGMAKGGINVVRTFSPDTGRVDSIFAQTLLGTTIQTFSFDFDVLGSLTAKADARRGLSETYGYDGLNRLTSVSGSASLTMNYDGLGNITSKSDVGTYTYTAGGKPHAVTNAGGVGYGYDGNGNLTSGDGRSNSYTVFNKPNSMSQAGNTVSIAYGPNRERIRRIELKSGQTTTTHYVGGFEKIWRPNGINETKRYLDGEVIVTTRSNGTQDVEYLFSDHLGSTDVITDNAGVIVQSMAFDAFGKRRDPINYAALSQTTIFNFDTTHTTKGFTSHEEMDPVGLVHMNGRVYEPRLGRFLSADPFVQDPTDTQSLNRHSYVSNNPLSYVDPSGYFSLKDGLQFVANAVVVAVSAVYCEGAMAGCIEVFNAIGLSAVNLGFGVGGSQSNNGAVQGGFNNGSPVQIPGCTASNGCILNAAADANAQADPIAGASSSGYSGQTGGNFENGAGTITFVGILRVGNDFAAWLNNTLLLGQRDRLFRAIGEDPNTVDKESIAYRAGEFAPLVAGGYGLLRYGVRAIVGLAERRTAAIAEAMVVDETIAARRAGETAIQLRKGDLINRVWDSRWTPGSRYSGPFGGSYSPTGSLPISRAEAVASRGLNVDGVLNNGGRGAIYEVTSDVSAILRRSIGGTADEIVIAPADRGAVQLIEESISRLP